MANLEVRVRGLDELQRKLRDAGQIERELRAPMERSQQRVEERTTYTQNSNPRKPTGSTYTRTFELLRSRNQSIRSVANGLLGRTEWSADHAPWVLSPQRQAGIHRGRWPTTEQIVREIERETVRDFDRTIERVLNR